ncbi:MAG: alpha/beta hydrolase-fold protein [Thermoguttaceae bacterium]
MPRTRHLVEPYCFVPPGLEETFGIDDAHSAPGQFEHALFAPIHYEPGYAYPLIVWLHGCGSDERQLPQLMSLLSLRNYVAVAPRGLPLPSAEPAKHPRHGWRQTDDYIQAAEQRVFESVEIARRQFHVAPKRVFLMGADRGGTMAMRIALSHPRRFAGVISLRGAFPSGRRPFGDLVAARRLGVFLAADRCGRRYPADQVCSDLRLMHAAGLSVTLRQYPSGPHLLRQMLSDVDRWVIDEITGAKRAASMATPSN